MSLEFNKIYNMDCIGGMKHIPDESIDLIICDLPYGITHNEWDTIIPFEDLWKAYERIVKPNAAILLFNQEPFGSKLRLSNEKMYRYDLIWEKPNPVGFLNANRMPLRVHENISVFYKKLPVYNPQKTYGGKPYIARDTVPSSNYGEYARHVTVNEDGLRYPTSVIHVPNAGDTIHPTQKPVSLIETLIRQYSNEEEVVLDNCMGSGTTAVACLQTKRNFIGFELNENYYKQSIKRLQQTTPALIS